MDHIALAAGSLHRHGAQLARHELFRFRDCVVFDGAVEGEEKVAITTKMSLRGAAQRAGDVAI